ncbi:zinc ribbon domain-containing protein [Candidatus Pacearchaeota archaeon]|nr:zinc ribbon domain-containing protein [Candidatus Pacearchaeota archaeon]
MFVKKQCPRCKEKLDKDFSFCPYCGFSLEKKKDNFWDDGFLDEIDFESMFSKFPFANLMQEIEKQFRDIDKTIKKEEEVKKMPVESGISISISTSNIGKPVIKVNRIGKGQQIPLRIVGVQPVMETTHQNLRNLEDKEIERMSKLPRKEAEAKVRRLSKKIIYEIDLPGVDSLKNVSIDRLENSIEVKAFTKDKAYFKLIPLKLPILRYSLKEGKLILELKPVD